MSKRIITMSMVLFALLGNLSHSYSQEICYTIADGYDKLYSLNPETGAVSFIGSTGVGNTESSALSQNGDTLYTANGNVFGWINLSTGTFTSIATIGSLQNGPEGSESVTDIDAMTTDVDGTIWAVERHDNGDLIFKINRKTGQPISNAFGSNMDYIQVQTTGSVPDRLDAIAIDPTTGILYASANNQSSSADDNYIITINKSNGVGTSIGLPDVGDIEGMTFTSTGQMIVTTGHQGYDKLFKINKANASSTYVGTFSTDSDFETCACAGQVDINPNTISGVVFKDTDGDGELDEGDNLWQNAKVRLFEDSNCNGEKDGSALDSALTDMNGSYAFMVSGVESSTGSITVQINNNANDVEERSDGSITSSSTDLDFESGTIVGMRFTSVDIPQGATITSAYINFYAEETDGSASSTKIRGEKSGNASAFTSSSYSLSNRTKTAGYTSWSIPSWTTGNWYQTPDITNIIQEIVNQGGWSANNAMVLFVEHLGGDDRQAESHDGYSSKAPKLVIEYTSGSSSECYVVEIDTTTLPTGFDMTTSTTQTASFTGSEESNENNNFGFELTTTGSNIIRGTVFNDASNDGELNNGENGTQNVTVELYRDLNCDGEINGLDNKVADTLSASSGSYSFSQAFSCSGTSSSTFTKRIASSNDDVYQKSDGEMRFTNSDVDLGDDLVGLRYDGIEIPQGATITSAKLTFIAKSDRSESTVLRIYGHKTLDADEFSNTDYDLSGRTKTSAYTVYSPSAWETGQSYESSDFSSVIQEIVDQQDWESGNALALILDDVSGKREAKTYDYDSEKGALLEIEFNTSSCTQCYIVRVVEGDLPSGSSLTTESSYEVTFTSVGNTSEDNDFGHYSMSSNGYTCYSISDANDALYTVNPSTGGSIFIGYTGVGNLESSAISFDGDTLYSIDGNDFGWVNLSTGDFTKVGDISTLQNGSLGAVSVTDVDAMTTGSDNSIYAVERYTGGDLIFKVNPATGDYVANAFGYQKDYIQLSTPSGVSNRLDAIGINPLTGVMYASANGQSSSANDNDIITIDLNTGVGTLIGNAGVGDLEGMTFNNAGKLFVTSGKDGYNTNKLYEINLSTGAATLIGALGGSDFETFACPGQDPQANLITGTVFHDANLNAFEDGDENGQSGVMVYLYDDVNGNGLLDGSDALVDSVESDGLGGYTFSVSYTSGTDYFIIITDTADYPEGNTLTTDNIETAVFSSGGNVEMENDFGFAAVNVISGTVFIDLDRDGEFEDEESVSANKEVVLYKDNNCNGLIDGSDEIVGRDTTDNNGYYSFFRSYSCGQSEGSLEISISSGSDDATEKTDGSMKLDRSGLKFKYSDYQYVGLRFTDVNLPQGATITSAKVVFEADRSDDQSASMLVYGEDTDDASGFTWSDDNISNRTSTTATVNWSPEDWSDGDNYYTPQLKTIVQEIVDRSGWSSGNDLALIFKHLSGDDRDAVSYEQSGNAPKLVITYEVSSSCTDCYVVSFDDNQLENDSTLTTDDIQTAEFNSGGNIDPNNNFGYFHISPVPVELLQFTGERVADVSMLYWITASEVTNSHFEVQRSNDGLSYETIGFVEGAGTTSEIQRYTFSDMNMPTGTNYYRLKQVDFDGQFEFHGPVILSDGDKQINANAYPNPATTELNVEILDTELLGSVSSIRLIDLYGHVVVEQTVESGQIKLDVKFLPRGVYQLEITTPTNREVRSIVIDRP